MLIIIINIWQIGCITNTNVVNSEVVVVRDVHQLIGVVHILIETAPPLHTLVVIHGLAPHILCEVVL